MTVVSTHLQVQSLASSLSTRQLLRIAKRMISNQEDNLYQAITKACLFRYAQIKLPDIITVVVRLSSHMSVYKLTL